MENMKQNYISEISGIGLEQIDFDKFRANSEHYLWDEAWTKKLKAKFGPVRIHKDKEGRLNFHFLAGYTVEQAKVIRKALRKVCREAQVPAFSVRKGRGTASGWIDISVMNSYRRFNFIENAVLESFGLQGGSNAELISPSQTNHYTEKALAILGEDGL